MATKNFGEQFIVYVDTGLSMVKETAKKCQPLFDHPAIEFMEFKLTVIGAK